MEMGLQEGVVTWLREGVVENGDISWGENYIPDVKLVKIPAGHIFLFD